MAVRCRCSSADRFAASSSRSAVRRRKHRRPRGRNNQIELQGGTGTGGPVPAGRTVHVAAEGLHVRQVLLHGCRTGGSKFRNAATKSLRERRAEAGTRRLFFRGRGFAARQPGRMSELVNEPAHGMIRPTWPVYKRVVPCWHAGLAGSSYLTHLVSANTSTPEGTAHGPAH
jgi:hypothetical protein